MADLIHAGSWYTLVHHLCPCVCL